MKLCNDSTYCCKLISSQGGGGGVLKSGIESYLLQSGLRQYLSIFSAKRDANIRQKFCSNKVNMSLKHQPNITGYNFVGLNTF